MRLYFAVCCGVLALAPGLRAADTPLADTGAFEYADAMSFYSFDGCGDGLAGRMYRRALADKFAHCPFAPAARVRYAERARAQQKKSSEVLGALIAEHGGLPMRLDGMTRTCREQTDSPEYVRFRGMLEQYADGEVSSDAVLPAPCDAKSLIP